MLPQEIVRLKRDGGTLDADHIDAFVRGLTDNSFSEAQVAALAMAIFFRGMSVDERVALTQAMMRSGTVLDWTGENLPGPILDKHSTGGVGDNVSLMLAPILAAMGAYVPMISGRGLGHTGGTLDKLDSIPGYTSQPDEALFRKVVRSAGCAIIGQTADLAPADKRFYSIRDVTGTVESVDLITASILSKKLAAGLEALVLDVKVGTGAFMATPNEARALAESLVLVANGAGMKTTALITDMNEPLAPCAGNAIEVREALDYLSGARRDPKLHAVVRALAVELAALGGIADGEMAFGRALDSGMAAERFMRMVADLGGPSDLMEAPDKHLEAAPIVRPVMADGSGTISGIDARALGVAVVALGGGRMKTSDAIDMAVGLSEIARVGESSGQPLCMVHARDEDQWEAAAASVRAAFTLGAGTMAPTMVHERIAPEVLSSV
ncbi:MAG: thymidine phosphorylase [Pseudomonadota bacterium]